MFLVSVLLYFNPRLREGGDALLMILIGIGIDFNPRLREGGDVTNFLDARWPRKFQSTPPRRRRLYPNIVNLKSLEFQSTPPRRRRRRVFREMEESYNFNPRLREGGDEKTKTATIIPFDFNPRLREGGDDSRGGG